MFRDGNESSRCVLKGLSCGVAVFVSVQVSAVAGVVDPLWWVLGVGAGLVVLDRRDAATSLLVLVGMLLGLVPVTGFLGLPPSLSSLGAALGVFVGVKVATTARGGVEAGWGGLLVVSPAIAGGAFAYWWWSDLFKGSKADVLTRLMTQWDLSTHFLFFSSIVRDGKYLALSSPPVDGYTWAGREYPAGIHYVWAQFALPLRDAAQIDRSVLIPFFAQAIVVTGALAVGVMSLGFARLGRSTLTRFWGALIGASLGIALICAGPLSSTFWWGFANNPAVAIGLSLLVSFLLKPHHESRTQFWVLTLGVWVLTYNWLPTVALFLPALVVLFWKAAMAGPKMRMASQTAICVVGALPPIVFALSLGVDHLQESGSVDEFPSSLLLGGSVIALGLALYLKDKFGISTALLLATPALLLYLLGRYLMNNVGQLSYYFDKFGLFVGTYMVLLLGGLLFCCSQEHLDSRYSRLSSRLRGTFGIVAISIGASQIFGYWGPELNGLSLQTAAPDRRIEIQERTSKLSDFYPLSKIIIRESARNKNRSFLEKSCLLIVLPRGVATDAAPTEELVFGVTDPGNALLLANIWFRALSDTALKESWSYPYELQFPEGLDTISIVTGLNDLASDFGRNQDVCILSTEVIADALTRSPYAWRTVVVES